MKSAASRSPFDRSFPVCTLAPPSAGAFSTSATFLPKYAAWAAPFSPAGAEPMTTRSNVSTALMGSPARDLPVREARQARADAVLVGEVQAREREALVVAALG